MNDFLQDIWGGLKSTAQQGWSFTIDQVNAQFQHQRVMEMMKRDAEIEAAQYRPDAQVYQQPQQPPMTGTGWNATPMVISPLMLALMAGGGLLLLTRK